MDIVAQGGAINRQSIAFPEQVKRGIANRDPVMTGIGLLEMDAGFSLVPTSDKEPIMRFSDDGRRRPETDDPIIWRQWLALWPDAEIGLAAGERFAFLDKDEPGNGAPYLAGLERTFQELRPEHWAHLLVGVPPGRSLRSSPLPRFGHVRAGRSYCRFLAPGYTPLDIDAPIMMLPDDSPVWVHAERPDTTTAYATGVVTAEDRTAARALDARLRSQSTYRSGYSLLHTRSWRDAIPPDNDRSESGRDFFLLFLASHFLRDDPRAAAVLTALLWQTGWPQSATRAHPKADPADYTARTVSAALQARICKDAERLHQLVDRHILPTLHASPSASPAAPLPGTVFDANLLSEGADMGTVIFAFAASEAVDEHTRAHGWRRFPVQDVADVFGVTREAVRKRMVLLEHQGVIERRSDPYQHDRRVRRDTCVRLPRPARR